MDITRLTGSSWSDSGLFSAGDRNDSAVNTFLEDTNEKTLTGKVSDLLSSTRMRHQRQFTDKQKELSQSASTPALPGSASAGLSGSATGGAKKVKKTPGRGSKTDDNAFSVIERPANRVDIANLERELEVRVKAIVDIDSVSIDDPNELADPRKDGMIIIRDKLLREFGADYERLKREPWLDMLIKCECIKITCDDVGKKLVDMLSVSSVELGNVLRKLRLTYMQSFEQMRVSWQLLRATFVEYENELFTDREKLNRLAYEVDNKEASVREIMNVEIAELTAQFEAEKAENVRALNESEFKMEQMGETLVSLNGIFKNMQMDGTTVRMSDLNDKINRLEKDNKELGGKVLSLDKTKNDLEIALEKIVTLEKENRAKDMEIANLKQQMIRREETVVALMERESIRNAEIEKMKDITGIQGDEEDYGVNMKEPSTSVLCIKCKKGLDDLSNIRAAILNKSDKAVVSCENFRVLLPNLRGRRPNRTAEWLRSCMRNIMVSKMREDVALLDIKGNSNKFSAYVYAWFCRPIDYANGSNELKTLQAADEDRWGLYYGVKAMARDNDPEAVIFWALLEERHGEDGMQFVFHCMSICLSLGGPDLWKQFGNSLSSSSCSIDVNQPDRPALRNHIWMDIGTAIESVKSILVRALKPHVQEVVDAIYAFRILPQVADPQVKADLKRQAEEAGEDAAHEGSGGNGEFSGEEKGETVAASIAEPSVDITQYDEDGNPIEVKEPEDTREPTHICIFVWLRLMMQQIQAEQIHRSAAVRLMCESASVGALTPQLQSITDKDDLGSQGAQVEYPQFSMIAKTLFPGISALDSATLYHACYDEGRRKVTSEVLLKIADRLGLFSKAMRLTVLPLLSHEIKEGKSFEELIVGLPRPSDESVVSGVEPSDQLLDEDEQTQEENEEMKKLNLPSEIPTSKEQRLRTQLANLIHRKSAAIIPDFNLLVQRVPDRWKSMLNEARDGVIQALIHATDKIKKDKLNNNDIKAPSQHFVDGIQPYIQYRRLLATMLMVKSFTDNPLLPSELFLGMDRTVLPSFEYSLRHAENLLSSLESAVVTALRLDKIDSPAQPTTRVLISTVKITEALAKKHFGSLGLSKVYRYEATRRNLVARKIQAWYHAYFQGLSKEGGFHKHYYTAAVPPNVRHYLRPGYIRGMRQLRVRAIDLPPWWAEAQLAEIMAYKINHDITAVRLGKSAMPIGQAVMAFYLHYWASIEVAERFVHDLMYCIRAHHLHSTRLGLFAKLLGVHTREAARNETEMEAVLARETMDSDEASKLLSSDIAVALYVNLLADIHREVVMYDISKNNVAATGAKASRASFLADVGITSVPVGNGGIVADDQGHANPLLLPGQTASDSQTDPAPAPTDVVKSEPIAADTTATVNETAAEGGATPAPKRLYRVNILYPVMENPTTRPDECAPWLVSPAILTAAVRRWTLNLRGLSAELLCVFIDFIKTLKSNTKDLVRRINVDDLCWLCMKQWAVYTAYSIHKCAARAAYAIKNGPISPMTNFVASPDSDMINAMYAEEDTDLGVPGRPSAFTTIYLYNIIDSIYKSSDGQIIRPVDIHLTPSLYVKSLSEGAIRAHSIKALNKLLREVTMWDAHATKILIRTQGEKTARQEEEVFITSWHTAAHDHEPASVLAFGWISKGSAEYLAIDNCKRTGSNYLPAITTLVDKKSEEFKKRQKNQQKGISEADGLRWDFASIKKLLDSTKLALRSVQHVHDEDLWGEKGETYLVEKMREVMSGVQDLISCTEYPSFLSGGEEGSAAMTMTGSFPSDLKEISSKPVIPKPAKESLAVFLTQLTNIS